jgi:hypothetical protein
VKALTTATNCATSSSVSLSKGMAALALIGNPQAAVVQLDHPVLEVADSVAHVSR